MRAGLLKKRVVIQNFTESQNDYGEPVKSWATFTTVWAQVTDVSGKEEFRNLQVASSVITQFRIRHKTGLDTKMRVSYNSRFFNILSIKEIGNREGLNIIAEDVAT